MFRSRSTEANEKDSSLLMNAVNRRMKVHHRTRVIILEECVSALLLLSTIFLRIEAVPA